jgi:UTP--glucose-1-phosphate uridylyltransferase
VLPGGIFELLRQTPRGRGNEIQLTDAIAMLCGAGQVFGYRCTGKRFDTGNPMGLLEASLHYSLKHPVYGAQARELIREAAKNCPQ